MHAHHHDYQPSEYGVRCAVEDCDAHENDGQNTGLGQILLDGYWLDYARATPLEAVAWAAKAPAERRAVDWISRKQLT